MNVWQAYRSLTPEQRSIISLKVVDLKRSPDDLIKLLAPIASYDTQVAGLRWMLVGRDTEADVLHELDDVDAAIRGQLAQLQSAVARFGLEQALLHLLDQAPALAGPDLKFG